VEATPAEVISRLQVLCSGPHFEFWSGDVSLLEHGLIKPEAIGGHRAITDVYLLALAVHRDGRLVTFDRSIPLRAVVGAGPKHLRLLGSSASDR